MKFKGGDKVQFTLTNSRFNDTIKVSYNKAVDSVGRFDAVKHYNQYKREHYDRLSLLIPKGGKEQLKQLVLTEKKDSVNKLIIEAIEQYYKIKL